MSSKEKTQKPQSKDNKKEKKGSRPDKRIDETPDYNLIQEFMTTVKRNKMNSFIVFSIAALLFLIVYFQFKYELQQRYSPDHMKEDADVSSKI